MAIQNSFIFHLGITQIALTFLIKLVLSVDSRFEACQPKSCKTGPKISYPFSILNTSTQFCGYPGFEVTCEDSRPLYKTSKGQYIIQNISYETSSFRIIHKEVAQINHSTTCLAPSTSYNFSLDRSPFKFRSIHADLYYVYNCTESVPLKYIQIPLNCPSKNTSSFLSLVHGDEGLDFDLEVCESSVLAPVELDFSESNATILTVDYIELLRRGFTLEWSGINCVKCEKSGGFCGFVNVTRVCFCPDRPYLKHCDEGKTNPKLILILVLVGSALVLILCSAIFIIRRRHKRNLFSYFSSKDKSRDLEDGSVYFGIPVFSYEELEDATHNFDPTQELGDGGFGTVYYGKLRDGREVAVKRLYEHNFKRVQQFMNEVEILTRLRHRNLVLLYGCTSRRSRELLLVYEYIPNGTVADHLHGERATPSSLTWPIRMKIAIETASALVYLHASEIIHRDVKTNNILLDNSFCVKVADFGLSRLLPNDVTHVSTAPQGTPGYVDPEYHQCYQLTDKSDVYSFGVVLIELISSMPAVDISRSRDEINLANLAINRIQRCAFDQLIDPSLGSDSDAEIERMTTSVAELAFRCLQFDSEMRPTMNEALDVLKEIQAEGSTEARDSIGELKNSKPMPSPSPETEVVVLLKNLPPSPVSVADKWLSSSSRSTTPSISA